MASNENVRLDTYLWAIRMFKTRSQASGAIADGKVKLAGNPCKSSHNVKIGEQYNLRLAEKKMSIQVSNLIKKRVQYSEAILNYFDISSEEEITFNKNKLTSSFYSGKRLSNIGRPTKKNQRDLTDFMGSGTENETDT